MLYESESTQYLLQGFLSEHTASLNLSLVVEAGRTSREVGGFAGECDGDGYQKLNFGSLSLMITLSGDNE